MAGSVVPPIGGRIRAERLRRGITVRGLAREVGVSASLISQIETDRKSPSVGTLYAITTALGISVEELFAHSDTRDAAETSGAGRPRMPTVPMPSMAWIGPVAGPGGRQVLKLDSGVTCELLGRMSDADLGFLLITYPPGGSSAGSGLLMRHPGIECGYLLSGELVLTLGFDEHHLAAGDSVCVDSTTPHGYRNKGNEPAVGVWFVLDRNVGQHG